MGDDGSPYKWAHGGGVDKIALNETETFNLAYPVAREISECEDEVREREIGYKLELISETAFESAEWVHDKTSDDHGEKSDEDRNTNELVLGGE